MALDKQISKSQGKKQQSSQIQAMQQAVVDSGPDFDQHIGNDEEGDVRNVEMNREKTFI